MGTPPPLFVFDGSSSGINVQMGDQVQVTGVVDQLFGLTE